MYVCIIFKLYQICYITENKSENFTWRQSTKLLLQNYFERKNMFVIQK